MELGEKEKCIEFLDVNTKLGWDKKGRVKVETGIYRKEAAANLYIQASSAHPESPKLGFIKGEIIRYVSLCSN